MRALRTGFKRAKPISCTLSLLATASFTVSMKALTAFSTSFLGSAVLDRNFRDQFTFVHKKILLNRYCAYVVALDYGHISTNIGKLHAFFGKILKNPHGNRVSGDCQGRFETFWPAASDFPALPGKVPSILSFGLHLGFQGFEPFLELVVARFSGFRFQVQFAGVQPGAKNRSPSSSSVASLSEAATACWSSFSSSCTFFQAAHPQSAGGPRHSRRELRRRLCHRAGRSAVRLHLSV